MCLSELDAPALRDRSSTSQSEGLAGLAGRLVSLSALSPHLGSTC